MAQTVFNADPTLAQEGLIANAFPSEEHNGKLANGAVPFARIVIQDVADDGDCKLPDDAGTLILNADSELVALGVSCLDQFREDASLDYADNEAVKLLAKGRIWVVAVDGCTVGDQAYAVTGTAEGNKGALYSTADAARTAVAGARFMTSATAGNLAQLEVNFIGQ